MEYKWVKKKEVVLSEYESLKNELAIPDVIAKMLISRGVNSFDEAKEFFRPRLENLHDPFLLKDMEKAADRMVKAIKNNDKIIVYGDYDVDGTTSVSMMTHFLKTYSDCIVEYYIPDRYSEGYGVSEKFIASLETKKPHLVITLDCGIRAVELIEKGSKHGVDFIICDHHEPGENLPPAHAVLDPKRKDCDYPFDGLSGCGVGFKLIQAVLVKLDMDESLAYQYLDFLTISIGADIVPINDENRILAFHGLVEINSNPRPGIKSILSLAGLKRAELTIEDVVFVIAPRINAAGRIKHAFAAVEMLLASSEAEAASVCQDIEGYNKERRSVDKEITAEALQCVKSDNFYLNSHSTVVWKEGWHKGVIGIVASRLIENYYKPTIVLTEKDGVATGSARSVKGLDIHKLLIETGDLLIKYGGHEMAAGLSIQSENLPEFRDQFEQAVKKETGEKLFSPEMDVEIELDFKDITAKLYRLIHQFSPFGPKNMTPLFITRNVEDAGYSKLVGETKDHLKLTLKQPVSGDIYFSGIAFKQAAKFEYLKSGKAVDIVYAIGMNEWNGKKTLQLEVRDIKPSVI